MYHQVIHFFFSLSFIFTTHGASQALPSSIQGEWRLLHRSIGISAMHMQLLSNNKVVMYDRTDFGASNLSLPLGRCRYDPNDTVLHFDCTAHSLVYDISTNTLRPLRVQTDTWCSSGTVLPSGTLVQTGGYNDGDRVVRIFTPCHDDMCNWLELPGYLSVRRWYASNQLLPDGRIIIMGGRRQFNYEFYPKNYNDLYPLVFLRDTSDDSENNLYPFVHLLPDGNLFIFANTRSILFDYKNNHIVKEFPSITGNDPRNYPSSGSSVLLPLDENKSHIEVEIMICGGAPREAFANALDNNFTRALSTCGRIKISDENPSWAMENMPMPRVMGDMILLPNGNVLIINGAGSGTAGWENARNPVTRPVIYHPTLDGERNSFSVMEESPIPRLYHSTAILITDGRILVGGSNPHIYYNFTNVEFPTELSLEAFSPPYLSQEYDLLRPKIVYSDEIFRYKSHTGIRFEVAKFLKTETLTVRIVAPSFTTHSFGMNQRMVVLKTVEVTYVELFKVYRVTVVGPSTAEIAPPGYYLLFVVHAGIPSSGTWVKVQ